MDGAFWRRVEQADGCWVWRGYRNRDGYGFTTVDGRKRRAHRVAYELAYGPIPEGMMVCHHCDNPACCRPEHLFLGSHADNMADMKRKGRVRHGARSALERMGRWNPTAAVLDADSVREIRSREGQSQRQLAAEFGVSQVAIHKVLARKTWRDI